jgi:hypothetical protein
VCAKKTVVLVGVVALAVLASMKLSVLMLQQFSAYVCSQVHAASVVCIVANHSAVTSIMLSAVAASKGSQCR